MMSFEIDISAIATLPAQQRILLTAHRLFYQEGIRATGIDKIIKESGVTKVTFYRHFPSKNDLIGAFLEYRHQRWINWFIEELKQQTMHHANLSLALTKCMASWFEQPSFRGCAFINTTVELGGLLPEIRELAYQHKKQMAQEISRYLPQDDQCEIRSEIIAMVLDGAIVKAQRELDLSAALTLIHSTLQALEQQWLTIRNAAK
ncbi:TetR/AcrR family transcriptional regulator [Yersinia similis]|nr:TetR/AcrR family transcriptional regulator [Yersinia similis]